MIAGRPWPRFASWQVTLAIALLVLGFLVAAQIRADATVQGYSSQERPALLRTVQDLQGQHATLTKQIQDLRSQIAVLRGQGHEAELAALNDQLKQTQLAAGLVQVEGPGMFVLLQDGSPLPGSDANEADYRINASDLRLVVNELWSAGAEVIAIDKERVVTSTAIVDAGSAIVVNSAYVSAPYQLSVIGPSDMWQKLTTAPSFRDWMEARYGPYRLGIGWQPASSVVVPGYAGGATLHYGRVVTPSASPSGAP
jgi:uncharacterized protein YlxW (UPF0749 family)